MSQAYVHSRYCKSFRRLMYMGLWTPDMISKPSHKRIFYVNAFLWQSALLIAISLQATDLYSALGDFKRMMFNFCSSTMVSGIFLKAILLFNKREKLRRIYFELWEDSTKYTDEEDVALLDTAYNRLNKFRKILYVGVFSVVSVMGFSSYFSYKWGRRILPFAGYLPMEDINNDVTYLPALLYECIMGLYTGVGILESDMTMLSLVSQIQAHCQILSKNLQKIDTFEEDEKEINFYLKNDKILKRLREVVKRHLELLKYCEDVESIFNLIMGLQLLAGSFLVVMNGVEATRQMSGMTTQLCYQLMYIFTIMFDLYMICHYSTTLTTECMNVGFTAYCTNWYKLDVRVKKSLWLITARAQKAPKFTYGKLFIIDVNAYMHLLKNIFSWLMLFRQLELK